MKRALLVFAMVAAFAVSALADWSGLADDQVISLFPNPVNYITSNNEIIAAAPNGVLYAVWALGASNVPNEVAFSKSTDNGRTWSGTAADRIINAQDGEGILIPTLQQSICMAVSGISNIYVVWAESLTNVSGGEIMFIKTTDAGATWINSSADYPISLPGGTTARQPVIAMDNDQNLHVVWQQSMGAHAEIHYGFSSDGGDTWTSQLADRVISFDNGNASFNPDMTIDDDNNVYVVWKESTGPNQFGVINFGKKLWSESQFSSETADLAVSLPDTNTGTCSIVATPNGSIHVVWEARHRIGTSYKGVIYYSRSIDGGSNWSGTISRQNVDYDAFDDTTSSYPEMAVTSQGYLAVVYSHEASPTQPRISYSTDNGVTWSGNTNAEVVSHWDGTDNRSGSNSDICISAGDTIHVVWQEDCMDIGGGSGYYEVMYSRGDVLATSAPNPGTISGLVQETDNTTPIANVIVETFDTFNTLMATDTTNGAGGYQAILAPGTYREHFAKTGYDAVDLNGIIVASDSTTDVLVTMSILSGCVYIPGDINGNGFSNGIDVTYGVAFFKGGNPPPDTCFDCPAAGQNLLATGDVNGNCAFNGIDITFYVAYLKGIQPTLRWCETCPPATRR
jgi:hypothetical protein